MQYLYTGSLAWDLIEYIQNMRIEAEFEGKDRIIISFESDDEIREVFRYWGTLIKDRTSANDIQCPILFEKFPQEPEGCKETHNLDGHQVTIWIRKA